LQNLTSGWRYPNIFELPGFVTQKFLNFRERIPKNSWFLGRVSWKFDKTFLLYFSKYHYTRKSRNVWVKIRGYSQFMTIIIWKLRNLRVMTPGDFLTSGYCSQEIDLKNNNNFHFLPAKFNFQVMIPRDFSISGYCYQEIATKKTKLSWIALGNSGQFRKKFGDLI